MEKSTVFFTKEITPESLVKMYERLGREATGKVGVKISTGESGGNHYLHPELIEKLVKKVNGIIVECNTAYEGSRNTTEKHLRTVKEHGFDKIAEVDIMDADGEIEIPCDGKHLDVDIVGKDLEKYDSLINLAHFKGHAMGGFGGVIKNQSIGVASANGKAYIHSAGKSRDPEKLWDGNIAEQDAFLESMAEAAKAVSDYMRGEILYINVINNISVDCDCDSNPEPPCMEDIGIVASLDPVAADQAAIDLVWTADDPGKEHMMERVNRQDGRHILPYAEEIGLGKRDYELVEVE